MDNRNVTGGGVKVTYIETQFVTSDAAGFKDLVQRLTGRSSAPAPPHRPRPCRQYDGHRRGTAAAAAAGAAAGPQQGYHGYTVAEARPAVTVSRTTTAYDLEGSMDLHDVIDMDFSDLLLYVGASQRSDGGCYGGFPC